MALELHTHTGSVELDVSGSPSRARAPSSSDGKAAELDAELSGLDKLEMVLPPRQSRPLGSGRRRGPRSWRSRSCSRSGSSSSGAAGSRSTCSRRRRRHSRLCGTTAPTNREAAAHDAADRVPRLRVLPDPRHRGRRARRPQPGAARRDRLDDHRPADDAVDRLVPVRHRPLRPERVARSSSWSCSGRHRRSPTASSPASTTSRRCSCVPAACSAPGGGRRSGT